jgi:outer membrane protein assembly factor BamA
MHGNNIATFVILTILLFSLVNSSYAEDLESFSSIENILPAKLDTIIVSGNRYTKDFVILQEIESRVDMFVDSDIIDRDRKRLESVGLFSRAILDVEKQNNGSVALKIHVVELWYIWPGLFIAFDEDDPSRHAIGFMLSHDNFRGRREKLIIGSRYGYMSGFTCEWQIPYLSIANPNWSMKYKARSMVEKEPKYLRSNEDIANEELSLKAEFGYKFSLQNRMWITLNYSTRKFVSLDDDLSVNEIDPNIPTDKNYYQIVDIGFKRDTRTYKPWPTDGSSIKLILGGGLDVIDYEESFVKVIGEVSKFASTSKRVHFAGHLRFDSIIGNPPIFKLLLLSSRNGLRTAMENIYVGRYRGLGTVEARFDLIPIHYRNLKTFKFMSNYSHDLKFGISLSIFSDSGFIGGGQRFTDDKDSEIHGWDNSYGIGLIIHVPYQDLIRLELVRSSFFPSDGIEFRVRIGATF